MIYWVIVEKVVEIGVIEMEIVIRGKVIGFYREII